MATPQPNLQRLGEVAVESLERQDWLEPLADRLQRAVVAAYQAGGATGRRIRDFLHGTWLGHPLHPVLTDVPLGAWTLATVLDLWGGANRHQDRAADAAIGVGLAGAVGAAVTGMTDWQHTTAEDRRVGLLHGLLNLSATGLYAVSLALRLRGVRTPGRTIGGLGFTVALGAAYLGGHLVYRKRIGVNHAPRADWDDFVTALPIGDLRESVPQRVDIAGVAVVLIRRASRIYALADSCAHLGGPLSEGQVDDLAIRCPWHGSRFALEDGGVLEGPSTFAQPCFDVRVRTGQIEVRARRSSRPATALPSSAS
jgi:nitrite reductase/ring-hydroxylating ferredoxin subunit/uncharacterized membrane protein